MWFDVGDVTLLTWNRPSWLIILNSEAIKLILWRCEYIRSIVEIRLRFVHLMNHTLWWSEFFILPWLWLHIEFNWRYLLCFRESWLLELLWLLCTFILLFTCVAFNLIPDTASSRSLLLCRRIILYWSRSLHRLMYDRLWWLKAYWFHRFWSFNLCGGFSWCLYLTWSYGWNLKRLRIFESFRLCEAVLLCRSIASGSLTDTWWWLGSQVINEIAFRCQRWIL